MSSVSCILCINRDDGFLKETIHSVLGQSYSDFEFIIVANNCPSSVIDLLNSFNDQRIKIIKSDLESIGYARNRGVDAASGELILMIDGDDVCEQNRFDQQVHFMNSNANISVASSWATKIDQHGNVIGQLRPTLPDNMAWLGIFSNPIINPAVIFRKSIWKKYKGYPGLSSSEDFAFWLNLVANRDYSIHIIESFLIRYRVHGNQTYRRRLPYAEAATFNLKLFYLGYGFKYLIGFGINTLKMIVRGKS